MNDGPHSGFARFPDAAARTRFARAELDGDAELTRHAHMAATRPTIVFDGLTDHQRKRVVAALAGVGEWFDDIQYQPTG